MQNHNSKFKNNNESSFTLLELLVVIAIIAILAGVVIASVVDLRQRAKESKGMQFSQNIRTTLSNELVGEWKFDEGEGTLAKDTSDEGNDGTLLPVTSPPQWTDEGKVKKALLFNGSSNYISVPHSTTLREAALAYTVEVWIKPEIDNDYWTGVVGKTGRNYHIWLGNSNNAAGGYIHHRFHTTSSTNDGCPDTPSGSIPMGNWSHVVITNSGTTCQTYINGEEKAPKTTTSSLVADSSMLYIGRNLDGAASNYFKGTIDEVRIYKTAFSAKQIKKLYAEGLLKYLADK